jgi:hypothetical protein
MLYGVFRREGEAGMDAGCNKKNRRMDAPVFFTSHFFAPAKKMFPP